MSLGARLRHAFAVDPDGPAEPTAQQQPAVDWLCREVARRRLTTPGLISLEMCRPLNFVGAQFLHFIAPWAGVLLSRQGHDHYQHFALFLERRGSMEYLARRIEYFEARCDASAPPPHGVAEGAEEGAAGRGDLQEDP